MTSFVIVGCCIRAILARAVGILYCNTDGICSLLKMARRTAKADQSMEDATFHTMAFIPRVTFREGLMSSDIHRLARAEALVRHCNELILQSIVLRLDQGCEIPPPPRTRPPLRPPPPNWRGLYKIRGRRGGKGKHKLDIDGNGVQRRRIAKTPSLPRGRRPSRRRRRSREPSLCRMRKSASDNGHVEAVVLVSSDSDTETCSSDLPVVVDL